MSGGNDVLSERESRTLAEIEDHVSTEDPAFARQLADGAPGTADVRRWPYTLALVLALVLMAVSLILALPVATALTAVLAAVLMGIRLRSRAASRGIERA
jgi:Flp pilus assembly protein TadB